MVNKNKILKSDQIFMAFSRNCDDIATAKNLHVSRSTIACYRAAYDCVTLIKLGPQMSQKYAIEYARLTDSMAIIKAAAKFIYTDIPQYIIDAIAEEWKGEINHNV